MLRCCFANCVHRNLRHASLLNFEMNSLHRDFFRWFNGSLTSVKNYIIGFKTLACWTFWTLAISQIVLTYVPKSFRTPSLVSSNPSSFCRLYRMFKSWVFCFAHVACLFSCFSTLEKNFYSKLWLIFCLFFVASSKMTMFRPRKTGRQLVVRVFTCKNRWSLHDFSLWWALQNIYSLQFWWGCFVWFFIVTASFSSEGPKKFCSTGFAPKGNKASAIGLFGVSERMVEKWISWKKKDKRSR